MKNSLMILSLIASVLLTGACNDSSKSAASNKAGTNNTGSFRVAYVKTDTLAEAYEYYNDLQTTLMLDQQEKEGDLNARYKSLQTKALKIQRDMQNNMITPTSAQKKQQSLVLEEQKLRQDQQRYEMEMMEKRQKLTLEILDSIKNYVALYNKEQNYDLVLTSDTLESNLLYIAPSADITSEIIKGLNRRYRAGKNNPEENNEKKENKEE